MSTIADRQLAMAANYTVVRRGTPGENLTGHKPWVIHKDKNLRWFLVLRDSDARPFLLLEGTTCEATARRELDQQIQMARGETRNL